MNNDFAKQFYASTAWKKCREAYRKKKCYICERCGGIATEVHHIQPITPDNLNDPKVSLSFDNLELLCRNHHAKEHNRTERGKRYYIDDQGRVIIRENIE